MQGLFEIKIQYVETGLILVEAETAEEAYQLAKHPSCIAVVDGNSKEMKEGSWEVVSLLNEIKDISTGDQNER